MPLAQLLLPTRVRVKEIRAFKGAIDIVAELSIGIPLAVRGRAKDPIFKILARHIRTVIADAIVGHPITARI